MNHVDFNNIRSYNGSSSSPEFNARRTQLNGKGLSSSSSSSYSYGAKANGKKEYNFGLIPTSSTENGESDPLEELSKSIEPLNKLRCAILSRSETNAIKELNLLKENRPRLVSLLEEDDGIRLINLAYANYLPGIAIELYSIIEEPVNEEKKQYYINSSKRTNQATTTNIKGTKLNNSGFLPTPLTNTKNCKTSMNVNKFNPIISKKIQKNTNTSNILLRSSSSSEHKNPKPSPISIDAGLTQTNNGSAMNNYAGKSSSSSSWKKF